MGAGTPPDAGLALLADTGRLLSKPPVTGELAAAIAELAVPAIADCCVVALPAQRGRVTWWRHSSGSGGDHGRIGLGALAALPGLAEVFTEPDRAKSVLLTTCAPSGWPLPPGFTVAGDVQVVPMLDPAGQGDRPIAVLILLHGAPNPPGRLDTDLVGEFADRAGAALANAIRFAEQAQLTTGLESSLLPAPLPTIPGVKLAAGYRPASTGLRVGGDFYEVYPRQPDRTETDDPVVFALGDACGHGPEAASLAGHVRSCLGALRLIESTPGKLLTLLNHAIRTTSASRFTTAVVGAMTARPEGGVRLAIGCAGHPSPLVRRNDRQVETLRVTGGLIGIFPEVRFGEVEIELAPGEICLLYSDGLTEARRAGDPGDQFGSDRLAELVAAHGEDTLEALIDAVLDELERWLAGHPHDDMTLLAIQADPE